jgi:hypothetical protein
LRVDVNEVLLLLQSSPAVMSFQSAESLGKLLIQGVCGIIPLAAAGSSQWLYDQVTLLLLLLLLC